MTTLAANQAREYQLGDEGRHPVVAADIIYEGAAVGKNSAVARPLQAGDVFLGFAQEKADNSAGAAGAVKVHTLKRGRIKLAVTGVTGAGDVGSAVYASDDATFTLSSTGNSLIGVIAEHVSSTTAIVAFDVDGRLLAAI
ncbi:cytoplasmic protein [Thalassobaculum sp.]|uniref:cytoplasmic protein n=1 Tax=Thalassobaculum sp. TaxID=2022740 RepID=UPI0032ED8F0A